MRFSWVKLKHGNSRVILTGVSPLINQSKHDSAVDCMKHLFNRVRAHRHTYFSFLGNVETACPLVSPTQSRSQLISFNNYVALDFSPLIVESKFGTQRRTDPQNASKCSSNKDLSVGTFFLPKGNTESAEWTCKYVLEIRPSTLTTTKYP